MSTFKLQAGVIENIDRARKQCLWRGNSQTSKGGNLAAWQMVIQPKAKGGLGIVDLKIQNDGLLIKQLHKFYTRKEVPWVHLIWDSYYQGRVPHAVRSIGSFWWKDVLKLFSLYKSLVACKVGDGSSTLLWSDIWLQQPISLMFPRLTSFALDWNSSIKDIRDAPVLASIFFLPLSE